MTDSKPSVLPLIAMVTAYMLVVVVTFGYFFTALMFGSEIYRDRGIPLAEWVGMTWPLAVTIAMLASTVIFWNRGQRRVSYALFAAMLIAILAIFTLVELPSI